jgi:hypothetical protein
MCPQNYYYYCTLWKSMLRVSESLSEVSKINCIQVLLKFHKYHTPVHESLYSNSNHHKNSVYSEFDLNPLIYYDEIKQFVWQTLKNWVKKQETVVIPVEMVILILKDITDFLEFETQIFFSTSLRNHVPHLHTRMHPYLETNLNKWETVQS